MSDRIYKREMSFKKQIYEVDIFMIVRTGLGDFTLTSETIHYVFTDFRK